jgi:hypothetical protein
MAGDNIFFSLADPLGDYTGTHSVFFRGVFLYFILQKEERSCDKQVGGKGGIVFFSVPNSLQGCDG